MCFSAAASFGAGLGLSLIGCVSVARAPSWRALPLAAMPLLFAAQQILEGGLWLELRDGEAPGCFGGAFSWFAQVVWPLYVPAALWLIEPAGRRRRAIALCGLAGVVVAGVLASGLVRVPILAELAEGHIFYRSGQFERLYNAGLFGPILLLYVMATCGSFVLSADRFLNAIGFAMAAAFAVSEAYYTAWLISVWCFFAALLSGLILIWVARTHRRFAPAFSRPLG